MRCNWSELIPFLELQIIYQAMSHLRSGILESSNTVPTVTVNWLLQFEQKRSPARIFFSGLAARSAILVLSLHLQCGHTMPPFHNTASRCLRAFLSVSKRRII